jgi:hypothetical protein
MDTNFEVVDLGVEVADYFQGFGVSFTPFSDSVVGVGNSPREALEDALEQIANSGDDTQELENAIREQHPRYYEAAGSQSVEEIVSEWEGDDNEQTDRYYYVGIRYNSEVNEEKRGR